MSADNENLEQYRLARQDELLRLSREERHIYAQVSRRGFIGATAAATLASLVGYEPKRLDAAGQAKSGARPGSHGRRRHRALDGRRHGQHGDVRPEALHAVCAGRADQGRAEHVSEHRHQRWTTSSSREGLENIASVMDKGTIIRGFTAADLGFILHSRHQYHWHTGYIPPQPQAMPAHRCGDLADARSQERGHAGVCRHRADGRRRW